ncbi:diguanylate cyclase domain-containing protein [Photobacterium minamisatsumaniensis]|uniref:GGDEF domain-containing protein n=1 Tax=Photobacterium minamisatsumaniensis TaxID=2910233 RepID=UPI003D0A03BA
MTDITAVASELSKVKLRLDQAQLSYRDASLKSRREIVILKRLISRLSIACRGLDGELDDKLSALRNDLEQHKDISKLIPRLAVVERLVTRLADFAQTENQHLSQQIQQSGEVLRRLQGLPPQLKRDLHNLLTQPTSTLASTHQQAIKLMALYERSLKLIALPTHELNHHSSSVDNDLQLQLTGELQHLITELDFDGEAGDKLLAVRNRLLIGVTPSTLIELALEVLRLVLDGTHQERRSSQRFLDDVNSDLATLQKTTSQSTGQSSAIYEHRCDMTNELAGIASSIRGGLKNNSNLENWRPELTNLTKELLVLTERNRALEKREKTLLEQLHYNEGKIHSLFEQTQDYRQRLNDQESRMFLDNLTRVYNHAALNDRLEHEYRRWLRYQHSVCVVMIDIDDFSGINERFGYLAGDKILRIIAKTIRQQLEDTDFIARFSDDEFVVILPDVNEQERIKRLKKVQDSITKLPFRFKEQNISISVSIGATLFEGNDTPSDIIERTTKTLNTARSTGNNRLLWIS